MLCCTSRKFQLFTGNTNLKEALSGTKIYSFKLKYFGVWIFLSEVIKIKYA